QQERRVALRTGFRDRSIPVNGFAFWVFGTPVEYLATFRFLDKQFAFASRSRTMDAGCFALDVFTFGVVRAGDELAVAAVTFHQLRLINRTFFIKQNRRRREFAAL